MLLQRTRAEQVGRIYERFVERYPEPKFLAREKPESLLRLTGSLGLRWRAPLMIETARALAGTGTPPDDLEQLMDLPGVGAYAAAAYLSFHRGKRAVIIDSNIVRLLGRVIGRKTDAETRRRLWLTRLADDLTPIRAFRDYNYAILDLAMSVCRPRPMCTACPLAQLPCRYAAVHEAAHA